MRITKKGVLGGLLALVVAAVCIRLGFWQLGRLEERRAMNQAYAAALALPPLELPGPGADSVAARPAAYVYRRVSVTGDPVAERQVIWRGRSRNGQPGVNILTPYEAAPGSVAIVNRGWVASPDAARVGPEALASPQNGGFTGVLIPFPDAAGRGATTTIHVDGAPVAAVQVPDSATLARHAGRPVLGLYVQRLPPSRDPGPVAPLDVPDLRDEGPHLGYAFQWFGFAAIALIGYLAVVLLRLRRAPR